MYDTKKTDSSFNYLSFLMQNLNSINQKFKYGTYAEYWTSPYNEVKHFNDHGWQMGFKDDFIGYSEAAKNLALSESDISCRNK